jgi:hypothetical protein
MTKQETAFWDAVNSWEDWFAWFPVKASYDGMGMVAHCSETAIYIRSMGVRQV